MTRLKLFTILSISALTLGCGNIDNYKEATGYIHGKLIDKTTGEAIPCQAPNGARIKLYEGKSTQPITVWARPDGTYNSDRVFSGTYKVSPEGPFIVTDADAKTIALPAADVNFTVEPYMRAKISNAVLSGTTVTVTFVISKSAENTGSMTKYSVLYGETNSVNTAGSAKKKEVVIGSQEGQIPETDVLDKPLTVTLDGVNTARPVFVRVAALSNKSSYWNYSEVRRLDK